MIGVKLRLTLHTKKMMMTDESRLTRHDLGIKPQRRGGNGFLAH